MTEEEESPRLGDDLVGTTTSLGVIIKQLKSTRSLLHTYTIYFKVAVAIGVLAIVTAGAAAIAQYQFNNDLERNFEADRVEALQREYDDCLQSNQGRQNIIEVILLLGSQSQQDDDETPEEQARDEARLQRFVELVQEKLPLRECIPPEGD